MDLLLLAGDGKVFPTYDKTTTAVFEIDLPDSSTLVDILLDSTPVDPSAYALTGSRLDMTLNSEFGPFTHDLILVLRMPEPGTLGLLGLALAGMLGWRRSAIGRASACGGRGVIEGAGA